MKKRRILSITAAVVALAITVSANTAALSAYAEEAAAETQGIMRISKSSFQIYQYDIQINAFKSAIEEKCGILYQTDQTTAKQIFDEYQELLTEDLQLHTLSDEILSYEKGDFAYDKNANIYLRARFDKFQSLANKYEALLERVDTELNSTNAQSLSIQSNTAEDNDNTCTNSPLAGLKAPLIKVDENGDVIDETDENQYADTDDNTVQDGGITESDIQSDDAEPTDISDNSDEYVDEALQDTELESGEITKDTLEDESGDESDEDITIDEQKDADMVATQATGASLTIKETTYYTISYDVTFPYNAKQKSVYIYNFNTSDGQTEFRSVHYSGSGSTRKINTNVKDGIHKLNYIPSLISGGRDVQFVPGGVYVLVAMWNYRTGDDMGGENTVHRFIQLPYNSTEEYKTISGGHVTATIEKDDAVASDRMETWIDRMDKVYTELQSFTGYTPYEGKKINILSSRENFSTHQPDGQNYWRLIMGWSGNPIKISQPFYHSHMRRSGSDWGDTPIHELSHDFDSYKWNFDNEALAFLKIPYVLQKQYAEVYRIDTMKGYSGMYYKNFLEHDWFEGYDESFKKGFYMPAGMATILLNIQEKTGWDAFGKTFRYFNELLDDQVPPTELGKLNLFLTQLQKFSGQDVFKLISTADKEILKTHFGGDIEPYTAPEIVFPQNSLGRTIDVSVQGGDYRQYQFKPSQSGKYTIFTSPYGESGVQNDTYIEVHTENSETAVPIATNDDWGDGRFSRTDVDLTANQVYYIKVYNYRRTGGRLHARLTIVKNITESELSEDVPQNVNVDATQFKMFKFTPTETGTYSFTADGYNGNPQTYDTYIKLYGGENLTNRIGQDENKIICNLTAGKTYYLQFSGMFMRSATGRVTVRRTNSLKFTKRYDSNFIYVNNPEYISNRDIVDDAKSGNDKLFEQKNVANKNTYYQTHLAWYNSDKNEEAYPSQNSFYIGIDLYNPNTYSVKMNVSNLVATENKTHLQKYINKQGENVENIIIAPKQHIQLFDYTNNKMICHRTGSLPSLYIIFDLEVRKTSGAVLPTNQGVTLSSLAAYDYENLRLADNSENSLVYNNILLKNGDVLHGDVARPTEHDLNIKYKGIARRQSNQIDAVMDFVIDDSTTGDIKFKLKDGEDLIDGYYPKEQADWNVQINPISDANESLLHTTMSNLHKFTYRFDDSKQWYFDFKHRNTDYLTTGDNSTDSINQAVSATVLNNAKNNIMSGTKSTGALDSAAIEMGSWGVVYHYTVTVNNTGTKTKKIKYRVKANAHYTLIGMRESASDIYTFKDTGEVKGYQIPFEVEIPPGQKTFEIVTMCGAGDGGLESTLIAE